MNNQTKGIVGAIDSATMHFLKLFKNEDNKVE
jgi:hypothetical protein